jgi:hypothetical protein
MKRVGRRGVILSLPDSSRAWTFCIHIPFYGDMKWLFKLPQIRRRAHEFDGQHYWEIDKKHFALRRIVKDICSAGLALENIYRKIFEHPYHRFFVLRST